VVAVEFFEFVKCSLRYDFNAAIVTNGSALSERFVLKKLKKNFFI